MSFKHTLVPSSKGKLHLLESVQEQKNTIFFLHGNSLCATAYRPLLEKMQALGYGVTAPDIRGHGSSTHEGTLPLKNWNSFIEDIAHILKRKAQGPVTGVGHSMGGFFLYAAAACYPELFSRLVLLDPVIFPPSYIALFRVTQALGLKNWFAMPRNTRKKRFRFPSKEEARRHYQGKGMFRHWHPQSLEGFLEGGLRPLAHTKDLELACNPELEARFYESVPPNTWQHAAAISCPVHIVRAAHSHLFRKEAALRLQKTIPLATFHEIPGCGHFFPLENPDLCASVLVQSCMCTDPDFS